MLNKGRTVKPCRNIFIRRPLSSRLLAVYPNSFQLDLGRDAPRQSFACHQACTGGTQHLEAARTTAKVAIVCMPQPADVTSVACFVGTMHRASSSRRSTSDYVEHGPTLESTWGWAQDRHARGDMHVVGTPMVAYDDPACPIRAPSIAGTTEEERKEAKEVATVARHRKSDQRASGEVTNVLCV